MTAPLQGEVPDVAIVLPPGEAFSAESSGAIALLVHAAMLAQSRYRRIVIGARCPEPYQDVPFQPLLPALGFGSRNQRYGSAVARHRPVARMMEVHNRPAVALRLARRLRATPISLFLHNDPQGMKGLRSPIQRRHAAAHLAGIVCVSAYLAERFAEGSGVNPIIIPNGIDVSNIPHGSAREKCILFAGRLVADKGADTFVAACARALPHLPGWRAEMIGADRFAAGSSDTVFTRRLMPRAASANVVLRGYLQHRAVLDAMARASIVIVPSRWNEPFGMVALEAMACGAALICSLRGGLDEIARDVAVCCDPDDAAELATAIRQLAGDPMEIARRGAVGRTRAALFNLSGLMQRLDGYRDTLKIAPGHDHMTPSRR